MKMDVPVWFSFCLVFLETQFGRADIVILPETVAYALENNPVTFTCNVTYANFSLINWKGSAYTYAFSIKKKTCVPFGPYINRTVYDFSCPSLKRFEWKILNVTNQQHGDQWCCQTNAINGTSSRNSTVFVKVPVRSVVFYDPNETLLTVIEYSPKVLRCLTSKERPRSTIQWYIQSQGTDISLGTGSILPMNNDALAMTVSTLNYTFTRNMTGSLVYCTASNIDGGELFLSKKKELIVEYTTNGPPVIVNFSDGALYKAVRSVDQLLFCSVKGGYPPPTLSWDCFSGEVTDVDAGHQEVKKQITWRATSIIGTSTCKCISNQSVSGEESVTLSVEVLYPPTSPVLTVGGINISENVKVIEDKSVSIKCDSSGNPKPSYEWIHRSFNNQTLYFGRVHVDDDRTYTCNVSNTMQPSQGSVQTKSASSSFHLDVLFKPSVEDLENMTVIENDRLSKDCSAESNPKPSKFTWTRQRDDFKKKTKTLLIENISRYDADVYTCTVQNVMHSTDGISEIGEGESSMNVKVLYHPDVTVSAVNGTAREGDENVVLLCTAKGEPADYNFTKWIHYTPDGSTLIQEYTSTSTNGDEAYLWFPNVTYMDSGFYYCFVTNGIKHSHGDEEAKNKTEQAVKGKPIVTEGEHVVAGATHENCALWVTYFSNDDYNVSVTWYRIVSGQKQPINSQNGKFVLDGDAADVNVKFYHVTVTLPGNKSQLSIQNVSDSDFGNYEVKLSNSIGSVVWGFNFKAKSPPDMPTQFTVIQGSVTPTSVLLSWISGFHGGADQTFYIQFKSLTSAWQNKTSVDGFQKKDTAFNCTADELIPATQYSFRLFSANKFNRSEFSAVVNVTTKAEERQNEDASLIGPGIGGGVGAALLIVALVALIIFLRRRNLTGRSTGQKSLLNEGYRQKEAMSDDLAEVQNPMYESAGPCANSSTNTDVFAKVDKTKKHDHLTSDSKGDVYSQVQKLHKSGTATIGNEKEQTADLYAMPVKAKVNHVHQKKEKKLKQEKKDKPGKKKGRLHGHVNEAMVYENSEEFRTRATDSDNAYELTCAGPQLPSRTKNPDGLIYVEVDHPRRNDKKDNTPIVIHGIDDRNDYAEIAFGKVGMPAPDSDDEQKSKDDAKETETV